MPRFAPPPELVPRAERGGGAAAASVSVIDHEGHIVLSRGAVRVQLCKESGLPGDDYVTTRRGSPAPSTPPLAATKR